MHFKFYQLHEVFDYIYAETWKSLVWKVDGGFNGDTICQTTLQQGKFEGYGSQLWTLETV